jgi:hypothetical protein
MKFYKTIWASPSHLLSTNQKKKRKTLTPTLLSHSTMKKRFKKISSLPLPSPFNILKKKKKKTLTPPSLAIQQ